MRYTFPAEYDTSTCYLVAINASLIPLVAGALKHFEERRSWHDDTEYEKAYNAFLELEICMTRACIDNLIESQDRMYRMLDTALYGTVYTVESTDPVLVVSPEIQPTHALGIIDPASIFGRLEDSRQLLQNALNGTSTDNYSRANGVRDLLESMLASTNAGDDIQAEELLKLVEIAGLLV